MLEDKDQNQASEWKIKAQIFGLTYLSYCGLHILRLSWSMIKPSLSTELQLTPSILGYLDFTFLIVYGIGNIIGGRLGESYNKKQFLVIINALSGIAFALIFLADYFSPYSQTYLFLILILNGFFQSAGYPTNIAIVSLYYKRKTRGFVLGCWASCQALGNIIGEQISGIVINSLGYHWTYVCFINGLINVLIGVLIALFMPSLSNQELRAQQAIELQDFSNQSARTLAIQMIPLKSVNQRIWSFLQSLCTQFQNKHIIQFACNFFFNKLVIYCLAYWLPFILTMVMGFTLYESAVIMTLFEIGGITGFFIQGVISDKYCIEQRGLVVLGSQILGTFIMSLLFLFERSSFYILIPLAGFLITGSSSLISATIPADLGQQSPETENEIQQIDEMNAIQTIQTQPDEKKEQISTATGIIDGFGSFGASFGNLCVGMIEQYYGWHYAFAALQVYLQSQLLNGLKNSFK